MDNTLTKSEKTYLALRELYESYGYRKYAMRKFEEYSLYLEHKNFLTSEFILTFNDPGGRLMALKPDVTLSILKNSTGGDRSEKVYYKESVYRLDRRSSEYREIEQLGLEMINCSDMISLTELCALAKGSLDAVDADNVLCVSDMRYVTGLLDALDAREGAREEIVSFIRAKNAHELKSALVRAGADESYADGFSSLIAFSDEKDLLSEAEKYALNDEMKSAVETLKKITGGAFGAISADLTLINDTAYYNGIVFSGYVSRIPRAVLNGGCYDRLAEKFGKKRGAAGFALCLSELNAYYDASPEYDADLLLLYSDVSDPEKVLETAEGYRRTGRSVRTEKSEPKGLRFKEKIIL